MLQQLLAVDDDRQIIGRSSNKVVRIPFLNLLLDPCQNSDQLRVLHLLLQFHRELIIELFFDRKHFHTELRSAIPARPLFVENSNRQCFGVVEERPFAHLLRGPDHKCVRFHRVLVLPQLFVAHQHLLDHLVLAARIDLVPFHLLPKRHCAEKRHEYQNHKRQRHNIPSFQTWVDQDPCLTF